MVHSRKAQKLGLDWPSRLFAAHYSTTIDRASLKKAGLPNVRFHDLRHSAATVLLAAKIDLKAVAELLGHSSVAITADIYQSVLSEQQQEIVKKMDGHRGRGRP